MKVIIDVQKLYDDISALDREDVKFYTTECLLSVLTKQTCFWPSWASKPTVTNKAKLSGGYTEEFESFWSNYPKKTGKGTAFLEWQKINKKEEILEMVLNALIWQKITWAKDNNKYVPMPENYLKGRRWEDEPINQAKVERYLTPDGVWKER